MIAISRIAPSAPRGAIRVCADRHILRATRPAVMGGASSQPTSTVARDYVLIMARTRQISETNYTAHVERLAERSAAAP